MNAIFQMLNPSNTLTVNRLLAHAIGLSEAVVYAALISKCSYYERNGMLDDSGWFYSTVPDLEASTALSEYQQKRCIKNLVDARAYRKQKSRASRQALFSYNRGYRTYLKPYFTGREKAVVHKTGCCAVLRKET